MSKLPIHRRRISAACIAALAFLVTALTPRAGRSAQAAAIGKELFEKRCGGCHALDRDKEGPRLRGVFGRVAGSVESFQYSDALKNSKITWNESTLDRWLLDTEKLIANNDMSFRVENRDERGEIIVYLQQNSDK